MSYALFLPYPIAGMAAIGDPEILGICVGVLVVVVLILLGLDFHLYRKRRRNWREEQERNEEMEERKRQIGRPDIFTGKFLLRFSQKARSARSSIRAAKANGNGTAHALPEIRKNGNPFGMNMADVSSKLAIASAKSEAATEDEQSPRTEYQLENECAVAEQPTSGPKETNNSHNKLLPLGEDTLTSIASRLTGNRNRVEPMTYANDDVFNEQTIPSDEDMVPKQKEPKRRSKKKKRKRLHSQNSRSTLLSKESDSIEGVEHLGFDHGDDIVNDKTYYNQLNDDDNGPTERRELEGNPPDYDLSNGVLPL